MDEIIYTQLDKTGLPVSYGHESVFEFYKRLNFFPRMFVLEWKNS